MSRSVTPVRRKRGDTESVDDEESLAGYGSQDSQASKRTRLNSYEGRGEVQDEISEASQRPLLPDNYRRSPTGKGRAVNGLPSTAVPEPDLLPHKPGSIVRITLKNFVTYGKAEFHPGPNLNMVIGPNGTGKSTLVCAICLGLGWSTAHLGRAKDISEFVKHGCQKATIEIELAKDPSRHDANPVVTTRIIKEGSKTDFFINGKKSTKKGVQELARSFSIQVDNLCQFLPQDRVVEFAALSPADLLVQTQRAAAPEYMSHWHEQLKSLRKEQKVKQVEHESLNDSLNGLENRQRAQEADVSRLKERSSLQDRLAALEKLRPFPAYTVATATYREAREKRRQAERDLRQLQRQLEPNLAAVKEKEQYIEKVANISKLRSRLVGRHEQTIGGLRDKYAMSEDGLKQLQTRREKEKQSIKEVRQSKARLGHSINMLKRVMENEPPAVDFAEMNAQIREKTRQLRELEDQERDITDEMRNLNGQGRQRTQLIEQKRDRKAHLQSQVGQQATRLSQVSQSCATAWEWLQRNRNLFSGPVFGPPMLECSVKDSTHTSAIETVIQQADLMAFTVTNKQDFNTLQRKFHGELHLNDMNIRVALTSLAEQRPACSDQQLKRLGLEAWILDLIDGPEPVLAMLCDNRGIHQIGLTSTELAVAQHEALKSSPISSWVTSKEYSLVARRREYGDKAVSVRVQPIRPARFFTDTPVNYEAEEAIDREIAELEDEIDTLKHEIQQNKTKLQNVQARVEELESEKKEIEKDKDEKQRERTKFDALPTKLQGEERKLADAERKIHDYQTTEKDFDEEADRVHVEKGQVALDFASAVEQLRTLHLQLLQAEVTEIEATSDLEQLRERHAEDTKSLAKFQADVEAFRQMQDQSLTAARALQEKCAEIGAVLNDFEASVNEEVQQLDPDQLETEIQSTRARLEMTSGGNVNVIREFEDRAKKIERRRDQSTNLQSVLQKLEGQIEKIKGQWETELDELVSKISAAFTENFAQIQCAGEVTVYKDDDFEQWAIQIKVKFREHEPLSVLDSHRQSGGERAVSTIFYLMALQSLARAPFRVVDEINQGMDPRNERLVHSRLVSIACASGHEDGRGGSQYFLITPKLLSGLEYHRNMKVHCIASGEWMPEDHSRLHFGELAQKALTVRTASS